MKMFQKKQQLVAAINNFVLGVREGAIKPKVEASGYAFHAGEPRNTIGHMLQAGGIRVLKRRQDDLFGGREAVAAALCVPAERLPEPVTQALAEVTAAEKKGETPYKRRRAAGPALLKLAKAISDANLRKPYTRKNVSAKDARENYAPQAQA